MRLLCAVTVHDRPEYTARTIQSWLDTCAERDSLIVVDNASGPETRRDLLRTWHPCPVIESDKNLFPGAATNIGWHHGLSTLGDFDLLMRSDNDIQYLPGWRQEVEKAFSTHETLGQLGILNTHEDYGGVENVPVKPWEENGHTLNVNSPWTGGNCVIRRELWDQGLRWDSNPWRPGANEDTLMSQAIHDLGWRVARVIPTIANNLSFHAFDAYPDYYRATAALRGLVPQLSV